MSDPFDLSLTPGRRPRERASSLFDRLRTFFSAQAQEQGRLEQLLALETLQQELQDLNPDRMSSRRVELQRGSSRFNPRARDATPYQEWLSERRRSRLNAEYPFYGGLRPREFEGLQTLEQVEERIRQVNDADMREFFDGEPGTRIPPLNPGQQPGQQPPSDDELDRPRTKRIKLDADDKREGLRAVQYGHYGQVVPGTLEMEIVSCDGGSYEANGKSSWPGNILVNDNSVYCTKGDRCNIILRHPGEVPFSLRKLTIKAPKSGFDSPYSVQEGMVFVSMDSDNLLARTAKYELMYSPSSASRSRRLRGLEQRYGMIRPSLISLNRAGMAGPDSNRLSSPNPSGQEPAPSSSSVRVTIDHDDRSEYEAGDEGRDTRPAPYGDFPDDMVDLFVPVDTDTDNTQDSEDNFETTLHALEHTNRRRLLEARRDLEAVRVDPSPPPPPPRQRYAPSPFVPADPPVSQDAPMDEESRLTTPPEVMKPHARFFIEREKSKVSIRFDPPASGRYILIKLWSPCGGGNIDIQSVIANGFAGPRYFPAMGLR